MITDLSVEFFKFLEYQVIVIATGTSEKVHISWQMDLNPPARFYFVLFNPMNLNQRRWNVLILKQILPTIH